MLVYRIEDWEGVGPYRSWATYHSGLANKMCRAGSRRTHPTPHDDAALKYIDADEVCGFADRRSLIDWFAGFADALHEEGFLLAVYRVDASRVRHGQNQVAFKPDPLSAPRRFTIHTLLKK